MSEVEGQGTPPEELASGAPAAPAASEAGATAGGGQDAPGQVPPAEAEPAAPPTEAPPDQAVLTEAMWASLPEEQRALYEATDESTMYWRLRVAEPSPAPTDEEEAAHAKFLETYEPVLTRMPQALADERAEQTAAEEAERARLVQEQAERDEVVRRKLEAADQAAAEEAAFRDEHYPGT